MHYSFLSLCNLSVFVWCLFVGWRGRIREGRVVMEAKRGRGKARDVLSWAEGGRYIKSEESRLFPSIFRRRWNCPNNWVGCTSERQCIKQRAASSEMSIRCLSLNQLHRGLECVWVCEFRMGSLLPSLPSLSRIITAYDTIFEHSVINAKWGFFWRRLTHPSRNRRGSDAKS